MNSAQTEWALHLYSGVPVVDFEGNWDEGTDRLLTDVITRLVGSGHMEISIGSETLILGPRDSVEYLSSVPHRAVNIGATSAQVMWITSHFTPPIDTNPLKAPMSQHIPSTKPTED